MIYIKERRWFWTKRKSPFENNLYIKYIYIYSYKINKSNLISVKFLVFNDTSSIWCNVLGLPWRMQNRINGASIVRYFNRLYDVFSLICNCSARRRRKKRGLLLSSHWFFKFHSYFIPIRAPEYIIVVCVTFHPWLPIPPFRPFLCIITKVLTKGFYARVVNIQYTWTLVYTHPSIHPYFNTTFIRTDICIFMDDKLKTLLNRWVIVNLT